METNHEEGFVSRVADDLKALLGFCVFAVILLWIPSFMYAKTKKITGDVGWYAAGFSLLAGLVILLIGLTLVAVNGALRALYSGYGVYAIINLVFLVLAAMATFTVCTKGIEIVNNIFGVDPEDDDLSGVAVFTAVLIVELGVVQLLTGWPVFTSFFMGIAQAFKV